MVRWEAMPAEPPLPMKMTRPPRSRVRNQAARVADDLREQRVIRRDHAVQAPHVIVEERLLIAIDRIKVGDMA